IEALVQERARKLGLDVSGTDGETRLRKLISDEVDLWNDEHRRGGRTVGFPDPEPVVAQAFVNLARYGPITALLDDPDVWEIMINAPDLVFCRRHRGPDGYHPDVFHDDAHVVRTLTKLLDDASTSHRKLDVAAGLQDAQLDDGSRVHIVHGELARGGHTMVNIRRFTGVALRDLDELVARDTLDAATAAFLRACVRVGLSIVVAGAPGSGKTTLMTCCAAELDPTLRVVVA